MSLLQSLNYPADFPYEVAVFVQGRSEALNNPERISEGEWKAFCDSHLLTMPQLHATLRLPQFQKDVNKCLEKLTDEGFVFQQKAALSAELVLEHLMQRLENLEHKDALVLLAKVTEIANLSQQQKAQQEARALSVNAQGNGTTFTLNINFPSGEKEVIEAKPVEAEET